MTSETNAANAIDTSLDDLLNRHFAGRVVRKDLTKLVKEGANVPVYVLEYLLGTYCASNDEEVIHDGLATVKRILAENYVRPDEAEKVKSTIRERGSLKIIDKVTVALNERRDVYEALLANLGVKGVEVRSSTVKKYEKLLVGGIWCIVTLGILLRGRPEGFALHYARSEAHPDAQHGSGRTVRGTPRLYRRAMDRCVCCAPPAWSRPILPNGSSGTCLARMIPLVENNYNVCELGPRGTGKSHIYKEISPNSILISGGQTTVANLFYNMARRMVGLGRVVGCRGLR